MNTLILIGAAQSLFISLFLISKKRRAASDNLLALLLLQFSFVFLAGYLAFEKDMPDLLLLLSNAALFISPTFYLYIQALVRPDRAFFPRRLFHYLPYLASWVYFAGLAAAGYGDLEFDNLFHEPSFWRRPFLFNLFYLAELFCIPIYVGHCLATLEKHRQKIKDRLSYSEGVDLRWVRFLLLVIVGIWILIAIPDALNLHFFQDSEQVILPPGLALSTLLIYYLSWSGLKQTTIFLEPDPMRQTTPSQEDRLIKEKYRKAALDPDTLEEKAEALELCMAEKKPYLQTKLSVSDLAEMLDMSSHNLSQLINEHLKTNFYDYINEKRVEAFKEQAADGLDRNVTLLSMAMDCGFNSKSSFNRVFKKMTGQTPTQYVKKLEK